MVQHIVSYHIILYTSVQATSLSALYRDVYPEIAKAQSSDEVRRQLKEVLVELYVMATYFDNLQKGETQQEALRLTFIG